MKEWLVVDGYNVINSWQDFRKFREENLEHARELLKEKLAEYIAFKGYSGIVVFETPERCWSPRKIGHESVGWAEPQNPIKSMNNVK